MPTPGAVQEQLRQQRPALQAPAEQPRVSTEQAAPTPVPPGGRKIRIDRFQLSGNSAIPTAELRELIAPFEGRELTLLEIYDVADAVTRHYRERGYTVASCTVPAQQVSSGTVMLEIIEGRVEDVRLEGTRRYQQDFVTGQLDELASGTVLTDDVLRRELDRLNQLPGFRTRAVIQPGDNYGQSDVVLRASEDLLSGQVRVNNYGRTSLGEWRVEGDLAINSPSGRGDRFDLTVVQAEGDHLNYYGGRYALPLPRSMYDGRLTVYFSHYDYEVDGSKLPPGLQNLGLSGEGNNYGFNVSRRFYPDDRGTLQLAIGYDRTETEQRLGLLGNVDERDIDLIVLSGVYSRLHDDNSYTSFGAQFSSNFDNNRRDPVTLAPENNAQPGKFRFDIGHYRYLTASWALVARGAAVVSLDQLVDTEQFRIGGPDSVRAYASSELAGDAGFSLEVELRRRLGLPENLRGEFYLFGDTGTVFRYNSELIGEPSDSMISSFGAGLDLQLWDRIELNLAVARRLGDRLPVDGREDVRGWFGMTVNF